MTLQDAQQNITLGSRVAYNDGRLRHSGVLATVLQVDSDGMTVQFDDRADTTYIAFTDRRWMNYLALSDQSHH